MKTIILNFVLTMNCLILSCFGSVAHANEMDKIRAQISAWLDSSQREKFQIIDVKTAGQRSFGGDPVLLIENNNHRLSFAAKAFIGKSKDSKFQTEIAGFDFLKKLNLKLSQGVEAEHWQQGDDFNLLIMKAAPGKTFYSSMRELSSSQTNLDQHLRVLEEMKLFAYKAGQALSELNSKYKRPLETSSQNIPRHYVEQMEKSIISLKAKAGIGLDIDFEKMDQEFNFLYPAFLRNPGWVGYTHGDAGVGNILYDSATSSITLIDLLTLLKSKNANDEPIGFPANEYYQFLSSVRVTNRMDALRIENTELEAVEEKFKQGYYSDQDNDLITPEADRFFSFLWEIKGKLIQSN